MISDLSTVDDVILDGLGNLEHGSYAFYFRYLDKDLNPTNEWIPISHYIKIGTGLQSNSSSSQLHGASNTESSPFYDSRSNKAIRLELANLDVNFRFYQIAVIKKTSDSGAYSGADLLYPIAIDNPANSFFIYTGYEDNIYGELSVDEVLIPNQPVDLVTTHAIDDQRLYLANLSKPLKDYVEDSVYSSLYPPKDYVNYQAFASRIKVKYYAEKVEGRQAKTGLNNAYGETLLPDEVYALGIIYVHSDGRESPVFHIPGRPADIDMTGHTSPIISTYTN